MKESQAEEGKDRLQTPPQTQKGFPYVFFV